MSVDEPAVTRTAKRQINIEKLVIQLKFRLFRIQVAGVGQDSPIWSWLTRGSGYLGAGAEG